MAAKFTETKIDLGVTFDDMGDKRFYVVGERIEQRWNDSGRLKTRTDRYYIVDRTTDERLRKTWNGVVISDGYQNHIAARTQCQDEEVKAKGGSIPFRPSNVSFF